MRNCIKRCLYHKVDNLVRDNAGVLVDGELGIVFGFLPRLITFKYHLIEARVLGDGGRIDPQFLILFSEVGVGPILLSFQDWYLSLVSCLKWSFALVSSAGLSKKPAKERKEIKTKNLSHKIRWPPIFFPSSSWSSCIGSKGRNRNKWL